MPTLYAYPDIRGVADNNPFGLKVYAFMRLCRMQFEHKHVLSTADAPRGQLPYLDDDGRSIGDSDAIIAYLKAHYDLTLDDGLTKSQRDLDVLVRRTLDDLYWPMSYSRWKDEKFWPSFRDMLLAEHADLTEYDLNAAREYNGLRYHYQGIGRYEPSEVYARGIENLRVVSDVIGLSDFAFGPAPCSLDAAIYGFVANIYFYDIDTPMKEFVLSRPNLVRHCEAIHSLVASG